MDTRRPPPQYSEINLQAKSRIVEPQSSGNEGWLVRRTSFTIESTPAYNDRAVENLDQVSLTSSAKSDGKRSLRNVLSKWGINQANEKPVDGRSVETTSAPFDASSQYGTTVSIEAGSTPKPRTQRVHEMKGLEQAASMFRWDGSGRPANAWGKLAKVKCFVCTYLLLKSLANNYEDPELWDDMGDTFVYFGFQRPQPSFRIRSSVMENTKSDVLIGKLRDGFHPATKSSSLYSPNSSRGIQNLNLNVGCKNPHASTGPKTGGGARTQYRIHFPAPEDVSRMELLRYHTTTRNFLALLKDKPLVGMTYFQALMDLFERVKLYMPPDCNPSEMVVAYLLKNHLHNIANDPGAAAGLLAWSEDVEVQWQEGWREAFVHCTGMYTQVQGRPEYRDISDTTCVLLNHAHLELQARIQEVEHRLSTFNFDDMWGPNSEIVPNARRSYDRFRSSLKGHYEAQHKRWPPRVSDETGGNWLNRTNVRQLQHDFAALFDAYVDRSKVGFGLTAGNECNQSCLSNSDDPINGDHQICLAKALATWDHKHKQKHLPRPIPLLPRPLPVPEKLKQPRSSFFGSKSKALGKQAIQAYEEARNPSSFDSPTIIAPNPLVERFRQFERMDLPGDLDPREARKGRWMLIYGMLQVLATISVDTPHLYFKDNVSYFLNPRLKGTPPWEIAVDHRVGEASPHYSHCWNVESPKPANGVP